MNKKKINKKIEELEKQVNGLKELLLCASFLAQTIESILDQKYDKDDFYQTDSKGRIKVLDD